MAFDVLQEMKIYYAIMLVTFVTCEICSAFSAIPFKARSVTIDYGMGRMAVFTFEPSKVEREMQSTQDDRRRAAEDRRKELFSFRSSESMEAAEPSMKAAEPTNPWHPGTKIVKIEFIFSADRKTEVAEAALKDIDLIDFTDSEIETMGEDGSWALSVRIKNLRTIPARTSGDRAVFIFGNYVFKERWLEIHGKTFIGE